MSDGEWEVRTTGCKRGSVMHCITQRVQPTVNNNCNWKIKSSKFIYKFKISKARNIFFCRNQCLEGSFFMVSSSLFPFFFNYAMESRILTSFTSDKSLDSDWIYMS